MDEDIKGILYFTFMIIIIISITVIISVTTFYFIEDKKIKKSFKNSISVSYGNKIITGKKEPFYKIYFMRYDMDNVHRIHSKKISW